MRYRSARGDWQVFWIVISKMKVGLDRDGVLEWETRFALDVFSYSHRCVCWSTEDFSIFFQFQVLDSHFEDTRTVILSRLFLCRNVAQG